MQFHAIPCNVNLYSCLYGFILSLAISCMISWHKVQSRRTYPGDPGLSCCWSGPGSEDCGHLGRVWRKRADGRPLDATEPSGSFLRHQGRQERRHHIARRFLPFSCHGSNAHTRRITILLTSMQWPGEARTGERIERDRVLQSIQWMPHHFIDIYTTCPFLS